MSMFSQAVPRSGPAGSVGRRLLLSRGTRTVVVATLAVGAVMVATGANAAAAPDAQPAAVAYVDDQVLSPGATIVVPLTGVATDAVSATFDVTGEYAWRATGLSVCPGTEVTEECKAAPALVTPVQSLGSATVTVPLAGGEKSVVFYNSVASVRASLTLMSVERPAAGGGSRPDAGNTGVPAGTALTVQTGNVTVTTPNTVIDSLDIRGFVVIRAPGVVIKNSIIRGGATDYDRGLVMVSKQVPASVTIQDSELAPLEPSFHIRGVIGANVTMIRTDVHHVVDQILVTGDNVTVRDSWFHDNAYWEVDPNYGNTPTHDDNVQISIGKNLRFTNNVMTGAKNAVLMVTQDRGHVTDLVFSGNHVDGGSCSVNLAEKAYGPLAGLTFTENVFGRSTRIENCAILAPTTTSALLSLAGNIYTDGTPVTVQRG